MSREINFFPDYIDLGQNFGEGGASSTFSWTAWAMPYVTANNHQVIGRYDGNRLFQIGHSGGLGWFVVYGVSPFDFIQVGSDATINTWYHLGFAFNAGTGTFYVNGALIGTDSSLTGAFDSAASLNLGRRGGDGAENWNGRIAEVGYYSAALVAADFLELAAGFTPPCVRPDALEHYWPLVGRASPEPDYWGGVNGTLNVTSTAEHPRVVQRRVQPISLGDTTSPPPPPPPPGGATGSWRTVARRARQHVRPGRPR